MELLVPNRGVPPIVLELDRVCHQYDRDLLFAFNAQSQQWCVWQQMAENSLWAEVEGKFIPVKGFAPNGRIPGVDELKKWLFESDVYRHDHLAQVKAHNFRVTQQKEAEWQEKNQEGAERIEFIMRKVDGVDTGRSISARRDGKRRRVF